MSSRNLNGEIGIGGGKFRRCSANDELAACDALPPLLRAIIKGSFISTMATTVLAEWRKLEQQGVPVEAYADWYAQRLGINMAKACLMTYGPDHPQAFPNLPKTPSFERPKSYAPAQTQFDNAPPPRAHKTAHNPPSKTADVSATRADAERRAAQIKINPDDIF